VDDGVAPLPAGLPFELKRGFLGTFASPPSLITIFAWISSSFAAFTFFGQNNVTNLRQSNVKMRGADGAGLVYARPEVFSPSITVLPCSLLGLKYDLYSAADGSERLLQNCNLVVARHVSARQLQLFL
jgi:hypothetical protein